MMVAYISLKAPGRHQGVAGCLAAYRHIALCTSIYGDQKLNMLSRGRPLAIPTCTIYIPMVSGDSESHCGPVSPQTLLQAHIQAHKINKHPKGAKA